MAEKKKRDKKKRDGGRKPGVYFGGPGRRKPPGVYFGNDWGKVRFGNARPPKGKGNAGWKPSPTPTMDYEQESAWDIMRDALENWGLTSLSDTLKNLILDGTTDANLLQIELQQTDEWKRRFAGNEKLRKAGLPVLSVSEYLSVERSYAQIMTNYGLPAGFYDQPSDFADFIGNSISPQELQQRVQMYADIAKREDPAVVEQLGALGLSEGDLLAQIMDPSRARPLLERKYQQTLIGAAARRQGLTPGNEYLGHLADIGVSEQQAVQGYGLISQGLSTYERLGDIYGEDYDQSDFESEVFEQGGEATRKRKRLASRERAEFSGTAGLGTSSLGSSSAGQY